MSILVENIQEMSYLKLDDLKLTNQGKSVMKADLSDFVSSPIIQNRKQQLALSVTQTPRGKSTFKVSTKDAKLE